MKHSLLRLTVPAVLAVLLSLPIVARAASHGEVASPTAFQLLSTAEADTPACHESLVSCGKRDAASLVPPEGASPREAYSFSEEAFSFDSGVDILLLTASPRQASEQGALLEWRWRLAYRRLGPDSFRLIQTGIQYRCGSGQWLKKACRPTGPVGKSVMSDFGASDVVRAGHAARAEAIQHENRPTADAQAASGKKGGTAGVERNDGSSRRSDRQAERRGTKNHLGLEGLDMFDEQKPRIQYRVPATPPDTMREARGFMPLALSSGDGTPATAPCENPIDLCGQRVLDEVYSSDMYGRLLPDQVRHESFVYGDEDDGVVRAVYLVTLVDLPDDIIEAERIRIGFVRRGSAWVAVSAGRQVRCRFGYARTEWRGEICSS